MELIGTSGWRSSRSMFGRSTYVASKSDFIFLPNPVQVGKFSAYSIENWDWSYNHCETHPTLDKYIASTQEAEIGTSMQCSSQSAFGRLTGDDISGHYNNNIF